MHVISVRNVHDALPVALRYLRDHGITSESRNGPVLMAPWPVTTVYHQPGELVMFHPERDANPALHLYEALWMLAGRNDVAPLVRYTKRFQSYSDNGRTIHDAYGYRWRTAFDRDQLGVIAHRLKNNPEDRRCVLQMWDTRLDLDNNGKAVPCNVTATFQVHPKTPRLDMTVFNRSNDIIWGAYGANAVHFGMLLLYMADRIGIPAGKYYQVSVNWHAYTDVLNTMTDIPTLPIIDNPYETRVRACPFVSDLDQICNLLVQADMGFAPISDAYTLKDPFFFNARAVLLAHELWRTLTGPERYDAALEVLARADQTVDWVVAMTEWLTRRRDKWEAKLKSSNPVQPTLGYQV